MSNPNTRLRTRQYSLIGGAVAILIAGVGAALFLFDDAEAPRQVSRKPHAVQITQPGTVTDKDEWRAQQAQQEKSNEKMIAETRFALKQQGEEFKKLAKDLDEVKSRKAGGRPGDGGPLDLPLPVMPPASLNSSGAGQRTLMPPVGGAKGAPPLLLNRPLVAPADVPRREVEMIQFNKVASGKPGGPGSADPVVLEADGVVAHHRVLDMLDDLLPRHGLDVVGIDVGDEPVL